MILLALMNIIVFNTIVCLLYITGGRKNKFDSVTNTDWSDRQFDQGGMET